MKTKYIILSKHNGAYALAGEVANGFKNTVLTGWASANKCTHLPMFDMDEGLELIVKLENVVDDQFFLVEITDQNYLRAHDISIVNALKLEKINFGDIHDSWSGFVLC